MSQDEFTKLFTYMEQRFDALEAKIDDKADKKQVDSLIGLVDTITKSQETDQQERLIANHQLGRHEDWIERAADTINVSYDPAA